MRNTCSSEKILLSVSPCSRARQVCGLLLSVCTLWLLAGCARFPANPINPNAPARSLAVAMTVAGVIDPNSYYFFAIDTDGDSATGPVPDATGLGNGWGIIAPTPAGSPVVQPAFYVVYHNGVFQQVHNGTALGQPYAYNVSGATLSMEIDLSLLGDPIPTPVEVNFITQQDVDTSSSTTPIVKSYDGMGPNGNDYFSPLDLDVAQTMIANQPGYPEELAYGQSYAGGGVESTTKIANLDITGWQLEVRLRN
jgi:hypothetical protein